MALYKLGVVIEATSENSPRIIIRPAADALMEALESLLLADQLRRIAPAYRAKGIDISHQGHSRDGALWRITTQKQYATPPGVPSSMGGIRYGEHK